MLRDAPEPCRSFVNVLVMVAPVAGALIFALGLPKLGWFNTFCACTSTCHSNLSVVWKFFIRARSMFRIGGPSRMLRPAFPNRPTLAGFEHTGVPAGHPGIAKAPRLIQ